MAFLVGILVGIMLPLQTAVNSNFKSRIKSLYLTALVAFLVATVFLSAATWLQGRSLLIPGNWFLNQPFWLWLGGVLGIIGGTIPIFLFSHLGAVQTVVLPIFGQVIMSMLIDNFGWFSSPVFRFNAWRLLGVVLLLVGLLLVIFVHINGGRFSYRQIGWQCLGLLAGMALATQAAVNGRLGTLLRSPVHAAFFSFLTGTVVLLLGTLLFHPAFSHLKLALGHGNPWWVWFGGLLGGLYVLGNSFLVPIIGTGATVVITLFGNILGGLVIDQFGLIGATQRSVKLRQYLGLILMIFGIVLVKLF